MLALVSSISPTKKEQAEKTRTAILRASAEVFAEVGFAGARTDAIAAAAGVNKALLYYYFESKSLLYAAVFEDQFREFAAAAVALLDGPGSPRTTLLRYVKLHFAAVSRVRRYAALHQQFMMTGDKIMLPLIRKYAVPRSQALSRLLERGIASGEFRAVDVRHTALSITSLIVHYFSIAPILKLAGRADAYSKAELRRRREAVLDLVTHALFRDAHAPLS